MLFSSILLGLPLISGVAAGPITGADSGTLVSRALTTDQQSALDAHNVVRATIWDKGTLPRPPTSKTKIPIPPLVWDDQLEAGALKWAQTLATSGKLVHSGTFGLGETIERISDSAAGTDFLTQATKIWIAKKKDFSPVEGNLFNPAAGLYIHPFTQTVWRDTKRVGMAWANATVVTGEGKTVTNWYIVAQYYPAGNFMMQKIF
ncbi:hypothetical protein NW762_012026 [Fusarium torreyae]|uniref:SCP domain-containing protein n=1 Tax=Fusarium torreyae TaxID=1237075 RepID=A0A9W8VBY2_9HYPO|nr:hypothetical protein NW762_012026 [Fusarium torreyae]